MNAMNSRRTAAIGVALAAVGIELQILGGADYPRIPPGLLILLAAAAVLFFFKQFWAIGIAAVATLLISIGGVVTPNLREQLTDSQSAVVFAGTLVQIIGLVGGLAFAVAALRLAFKRRHSAAGLR